MRLRTLGAAVAAVLALAGLAGCRTNIGTAAMIDGHRVTESDVNDYITPRASVALQQGGGGTFTESPRSFVVRELIDDAFFRKLLGEVPGGGAPTDAQLDARLHADLNGRDPKQFAESIGLKGFTADFDRLFLRVQELGGALNTAQQNGVDVNAVAKKLDFPVSVGARYGTWHGAKFSFDGNPALPAYLTVQPAG